MIKRSFVCAMLFGWLMASGPVQAHHSIAGVYDMHSEKTVSGVVERMAAINPHGLMVIGVTNQDGSKTDWSMTLGSVTTLAQKGMVRDGPNALHAGDKISVKFLPAKDGSPLGLLREFTMPDGRVVVMSAQDATR